MCQKPPPGAASSKAIKTRGEVTRAVVPRGGTSVEIMFWLKLRGNTMPLC